MASTESRLRTLIADNLEVDGKPVDSSLALTDSLTNQGLSSMDLVSFARVIQGEFGVELTVDDCMRLKSLNELIEFIDSK